MRDIFLCKQVTFSPIVFSANFAFFNNQNFVMSYGKYLLVLFCLCFIACKQPEKTDKEKFFPVLSFLQGQVASMDTSLYSILKLVTIDSLRTDTFYIHRENFRKEANDFLTIPDIAESKYADRFIEEKSFDETLNRVLITYIPVKPEKEIIQRQEILIKPDPSGDKLTNIIINSVYSTKDSTVQKKLLWRVDESFQVTTTKQLPGQPETNSTVKVVWNESE
jgi:hypothetical protein